MTFDDVLVMEQLKSSGMSETVRIKQSSYPIRIPHDRFKNQYSALLPRQCGSRAKIQRQLDALGLHSGSFQVGRSLIFLKEDSKKLLDEKLESAVIDKVVLLQRNVRFWLTRRQRQHAADEIAENEKRNSAATIIQTYWRGDLQMMIYVDTRIATITIQRWWRTQRIRDRYLKLQQAVIDIQCFARRYIARMELKRLRHEKYRLIEMSIEQANRKIQNENSAAAVIQAAWRGYNARQGYQETLRSIRIIQRAYRTYRAAKYFEAHQTEKFLTMKKLEAITPPPTFVPEAPSDMLNTAFVFEDLEETLIVSNKETTPEKEIKREVRKESRKRRQSPETKWLIPEQLVDVKLDVKERTKSFVDIKDPTITYADRKSKTPPPVVQDEVDGSITPPGGTVKPPTTHLTQQPYQVQLVRKETLRSKVYQPNPVRNRTSWLEMEHMTPKVTPPNEENQKERTISFEGVHDIAERTKSFDDIDGITVKKANRKHKRDQEKQMLKSQLPAPRGSTNNTDHRPPRPRSKTRRSSEDLDTSRSER